MNFEELLKALKPEQAEVITKHIEAAVATSVSEAEAKKDDVIKGLDETIAGLNGTVETLQKAKPTTEPQEDILNGASPELKEAFEKLRGEVKALADAQQEELAKARYAKVKAIPVEETELKGILKSASPAVVAILEKASAAIEAGLAPQGKETNNQFAGETADAYYGKLENAAKDLMSKTETGMTFEKAFSIACEQNPEIYANYVKGAR